MEATGKLRPVEQRRRGINCSKAGSRVPLLVAVLDPDTGGSSDVLCCWQLYGRRQGWEKKNLCFGISVALWREMGVWVEFTPRVMFTALHLSVTGRNCFCSVSSEGITPSGGCHAPDGTRWVGALPAWAGAWMLLRRGTGNLGLVWGVFWRRQSAQI